ncbi:meiosis-specific with OB domain-containing protein-like [Amphiura filiformis]|uniref:meiosis-specific with OB domain-containing protein-like n=1 Tax=Amphiura filiformis TaxID=82378 RepID=UPI003B212A41
MAWSGDVQGGGGGFGTQSTWPDGTSIGNNNSSNVTSGRTAINELSPHMPNVFVVGVVISKQSPRSVPSKSEPGSERSILNFTLRDSPVDFINVSCWGTDSFISDLNRKFKIGDPVEIRNPQIQSKQNNEAEERFRAWTPGPFQLSISERYSSINIYGGWDATNPQMTSLRHIPVRESDNYYTLSDVMTNGQGLHGEHINLLVLVKSISEPRDITTKTGRHIKRCEVTLYDEGCAKFSFILWDEETIDFATGWTPKETVLFAADVLVKFDDFRHGMTATVDSKTILTINPDTREAHSLYKFRLSYEDDDTDGAGGDEWQGQGNIDLNTIQDVYCVGSLKSNSLEKGNAVDYGITYAFLSAFDLDGPRRIKNIVITQCAACKRRVDAASNCCVNVNCPSSTSGNTETTMAFSISVDLTDHTGTVNGCYLGGEAAEQMLGISVDDFCCLDETQKTAIKWKHLLERCKVYLKITHPGPNRPKRIIRVLSCTVADPAETERNV